MLVPAEAPRAVVRVSSVEELQAAIAKTSASSPLHLLVHVRSPAFLAALPRALSHLRAYLALDCSTAGLGPHDCLALASLLASRSLSLYRLDLSYNAIGDAGMNVLLAGTAFYSLLTLNAAYCGITDATLRNLRSFAIDAYAGAALEDLGDFGFCELSLEGNPITGAGAEALGAILGRCPCLRRLSLSQCDLGPGDAAEVLFGALESGEAGSVGGAGGNGLSGKPEWARSPSPGQRASHGSHGSRGSHNLREPRSPQSPLSGLEEEAPSLRSSLQEIYLHSLEVTPSDAIEEAEGDISRLFEAIAAFPALQVLDLGGFRVSAASGSLGGAAGATRENAGTARAPRGTFDPHRERGRDPDPGLDLARDGAEASLAMTESLGPPQGQPGRQRPTWGRRDWAMASYSLASLSVSPGGLGGSGRSEGLRGIDAPGALGVSESEERDRGERDGRSGRRSSYSSHDLSDAHAHAHVARPPRRASPPPRRAPAGESPAENLRVLFAESLCSALPGLTHLRHLYLDDSGLGCAVVLSVLGALESSVIVPGETAASAGPAAPSGLHSPAKRATPSAGLAELRYVCLDGNPGARILRPAGPWGSWGTLSDPDSAGRAASPSDHPSRAVDYLYRAGVVVSARIFDPSLLQAAKAPGSTGMLGGTERGLAAAGFSPAIERIDWSCPALLLHGPAVYNQLYSAEGGEADAVCQPPLDSRAPLDTQAPRPDSSAPLRRSTGLWDPEGGREETFALPDAVAGVSGSREAGSALAGLSDPGLLEAPWEGEGTAVWPADRDVRGGEPVGSAPRPAPRPPRPLPMWSAAERTEKSAGSIVEEVGAVDDGYFFGNPEGGAPEPLHTGVSAADQGGRNQGGSDASGASGVPGAPRAPEASRAGDNDDDEDEEDMSASELCAAPEPRRDAAKRSPPSGEDPGLGERVEGYLSTLEEDVPAFGFDAPDEAEGPVDGDGKTQTAPAASEAPRDVPPALGGSESPTSDQQGTLSPASPPTLPPSNLSQSLRASQSPPIVRTVIGRMSLRLSQMTPQDRALVRSRIEELAQAVPASAFVERPATAQRASQGGVDDPTPVAPAEGIRPQTAYVPGRVPPRPEAGAKPAAQSEPVVVRMLYHADASAGGNIPDAEARGALLARLLRSLRSGITDFPEFICVIDARGSKYHNRASGRLILRRRTSPQRARSEFPDEVAFPLTAGAGLAVSVVDGSGLLVLQSPGRLAVLDAGESRDGLVFLLGRALGQGAPHSASGVQKV